MYKIIKLISIFLFSLGCNSTCDAGPIEIKFQSLLDQFRKESFAPAAVMTIKLLEKNITLNFTSGTILKITPETPNPKKVTTNNLFQIGSITKSFTAAIILQLEAERKISINDTIADTVKNYGQWLPEKEYQAWKAITIKQLLNMTSGIFDITDDLQFKDTFLVKQPKKNWQSKELLDIAVKHKPYFSPGMGWHYSNTNYNILEMLIDAVTGHIFEEEIKHRLLAPLNLKNTYFLPSVYPKKIMNRMAHGYVYPGGDFSPPAIPGTDMTNINLSVAGASGAMVSNTHDIIRWVEALFSGKVLKMKQQTEMMSAVCVSNKNDCRAGKPFIPNSQSEGFSLGLAYLDHPVLGKTWFYVGSTPGYYAAFIWLPQRKIILSMTLSASSRNSKKILKVLMNAAKLCIRQNL